MFEMLGRCGIRNRLVMVVLITLPNWPASLRTRWSISKTEGHNPHPAITINLPTTILPLDFAGMLRWPTRIFSGSAQSLLPVVGQSAAKDLMVGSIRPTRDFRNATRLVDPALHAGLHPCRHATVWLTARSNKNEFPPSHIDKWIHIWWPSVAINRASRGCYGRDLVCTQVEHSSAYSSSNHPAMHTPPGTATGGH